MRRRFIDRDIWQSDIFLELSPARKALWFYLWSVSDEAGTFQFSEKLSSVFVGCKMTESDVAALPGLVKLNNGRWLIRSLIKVEYEELKETVRPHQKAIRIVSEMGLAEYLSDTYGIGMPYLSENSGYHKEGEGEGDQEKDRGDARGGCYPPESRVALLYLNEKSGRSFRETAKNLDFIAARLKEPGVTIEGVRLMIDRQCKRWLNTTQAEFLRPETLFNATKFDGYYAAKDAPVILNGEPPRQTTCL